jgi:hypothetical protein
VQICLSHRLRNLLFNCPLLEAIGSSAGRACPRNSLTKHELRTKEPPHRHLGQNGRIRVILRRCFEHRNLPRSIRVQRQDARCVVVAVAVVRCRPHCYELLVEEVLVPFHHKLMSTCYEGQAVDSVELRDRLSSRGRTVGRNSRPTCSVTTFPKR